MKIRKHIGHECPAPDCIARVTYSQFACKKHWLMLPETMRKTVSHEFTYRNRDGGVAHMRAALDAVNYLKEQVGKESEK